MTGRVGGDDPGIPNWEKSTFINKVAGARPPKTEDDPGGYPLQAVGAD